jgi:hypothetical protein
VDVLGRRPKVPTLALLRLTWPPAGELGTNVNVHVLTFEVLEGDPPPPPSLMPDIPAHVHPIVPIEHDSVTALLSDRLVYWRTPLTPEFDRLRGPLMRAQRYLRTRKWIGPWKDPADADGATEATDLETAEVDSITEET